MDDTTIAGLLVGLPIVLAILAILVLGWRSEMKRRRKKWAEIERQRRRSLPLPPGTTWVRTTPLQAEIQRELVGMILLVAIGDYGTNMLIRLLKLLARCGLDRLVGGILISNNDSSSRIQFHSRIPEVYHDRVVYAFTENFSSGFGNRSIQWVLDHVDQWGGPIVDGVAEVIDKHLRLTGNLAPGIILPFVSLGGHAVTGLLAVELLHKRFEESLCAAFTALPTHRWLRKNYELLKTEYEKRGVFGWILSDNLGDEPVTADYGAVTLITALCDAALHADMRTRIDNVLTLTFTKYPGSILVYEVVQGSVIAEPWPDKDDPVGYYVVKQPLAIEVNKLLRRLAGGQGVMSAELPIGEKGTSVFDIVMAPLLPSDLLWLKDEEFRMLKLREQYGTLSSNGSASGHTRLIGVPDRDRQFASYATVIDPKKPLCGMIGVRLSAVRDGEDIVAEIVKAPADRMLPSHGRPALLPGSGHVSQPPAGEEKKRRKYTRKEKRNVQTNSH